jgi:putative glycosyltransferase (TIGR04348 family)
MGSARPVVFIVTPGTRSENNGNWRTAARWAGMLRGRCKVIVQTRWEGERADALVALHARRSADSVERFHARHPDRAIAVMLTGTDLYRDLPESRAAARSLDIAHAIVTLQDDAFRLLAPAWRAKARVIYQSARALRAVRKRPGRIDCVAVGHLRDVKDPRTVFEAMRHLHDDLPIRLRHYGAPLDAKLAREAAALAARDPRYRYLGAKPHGVVRAAMRSSHLLVHPSLMEGGANVIVEAVTAGTAVLASRVSGNVGMLGRGYAGYFDAGDAAALASLMARALEAPFLARLERQCAARRALFSPVGEARAVRRLVRELGCNCGVKITTHGNRPGASTMDMQVRLTQFSHGGRLRVQDRARRARADPRQGRSRHPAQGIAGRHRDQRRRRGLPHQRHAGDRGHDRLLHADRRRPVRFRRHRRDQRDLRCLRDGWAAALRARARRHARQPDSRST